jgi:hypothetical protein
LAIDSLLALQGVDMPSCKIIVVGAVLRAAFIVAIAVGASNAFEPGGTLANQATGPHQLHLYPTRPAESIDIDETPNTEPWGPLRTTDW